MIESLEDRCYLSFTIGAMGDSLTDEWSQFGFPGLATWIEFLDLTGRADAGVLESFPEGDPRAASIGKSYTYNFAAHGSGANSYSGTTAVLGNPPVTVQNYHSQFGSPNAPEYWGGPRELGLTGELEYLAQFIGMADLLRNMGTDGLGGGPRPDLIDVIYDQIVEGLDIVTVNGTSPLKIILLTVQDLSLLPAWVPFNFTEQQRDNIRGNLLDFNTRLRDLADERGYGVADLGVLWNQAISPEGIVLGDITIDPYDTEPVGAPLTTLNRFYLGDGFHPTPAIHLLLANEIMEQIRDVFHEPDIVLYTDKEVLHYSGLDVNDAPIADAGGPYTVVPGLSLTLNASASHDWDEIDTLSYSWDINGDGTYGDAVGVNPTLTWAQLEALGIEPEGEYDVRVRVDDGFAIDGVTFSEPTTLSVSTSMQAVITGPTTLDEGGAIILSAQNSIGLISSYAWDLDNDGQFDDSTDSVAPFSALDNGTYTVRLRVEGIQGTSTTSQVIEVNNLTPIAFTVGEQQVARGTEFTIGLVAIDFSPIDAVADFSFEIDWDGNGTVDDTVVGPNGTMASTTWQTIGTRAVTVVAVDKDGGRSEAVTHEVEVVPYSLQEGILYWFGSGGDDQALLTSVDATTVQWEELKENGVAVSRTYQIAGVTGTVVAVARAGNDILDARGSNHPVSFRGDEGADVLWGSPLADTILGGTGNDTLYGNNGNDFLSGDENDDHIYGEYLKSSGLPVTAASFGSDTILGGDGNDTIYGDSDGGEGAADAIDGGIGNDTIIADGSEGNSTAADTILGGDGNDNIIADPSGGKGAADFVDAGIGNDTVDGGGGNDYIDGNDGDDLLIGGTGTGGADDFILGGAGRDILIGDSVSNLPATTAGADTLSGGANDDLIITGFLVLPSNATLDSIRTIWSSTQSYSARRSQILDPPASPPGATALLTPGVQVMADTVVDQVLGDAGQDLFLVDTALDILIDRVGNESIVDI